MVCEAMKIEVYDIECLGGMFLYMGYIPPLDKWYSFEISKRKSELYALVRHLEECDRFGVSYNGLSYDAQVLQFIVENYERWVDLSNKEIIKKIKKFSDKIIDDGNYDLFPPYKEESFINPQIDLMRVHHFDNENRRVSLKWLQFSMDFYNVEEMPYPHWQEEFTDEELDEIVDYCKNDVESTYELWKYTIGEVEHKEYKGKNKIQDRLDLIEELGLPKKALSWSDVKIGDEINKKIYCELSGITPNMLYELKAKRKTKRLPKGFTYGDCIPSYVIFKTKPFQEFLERMKKVRVNLKEKEEHPFVYNGTHYMIAKGGIHSNEKNRIIEPLANEILLDADIGSQYPHSLIKRGIFPSHLGKLWLVGYSEMRDKRIKYKKLLYDKSISEEDRRKYKGLSDAYKLSLNGSFGKLNESTSWLYDPFALHQCTIGNQFEILMLIEGLEINDIHVISANTDGIVCLFDRSKVDKYYEICHEWEKVVGNDKQGQLEYAEYKKIIQLSVNGYLAIKSDGEIKKKKDFLTEYELHKDKSMRIVPIALEKYFVDGISVEETIRKHDNIFDFFIGVKASKHYHYEAYDKDGNGEVYHRMVRYDVSTDGKKLLKIKNEDSDADGADVSQCEAGDWKCTVANKVDKTKKIEDYNIDYKYYIWKAEEIIKAVSTGKRTKGKPINPNQTSLF